MDVPEKSHAETIRFSGRSQAQALILEMAQQARQQICIQSIHIDPLLFDNAAFLAQLQRLALRSDKTRIRILVHDTLINARNDHRLIPLAQHLSSSIFIHRTARQHKDNQSTLFLVDDYAYLHCPIATVYEGTASLYDRFQVRQHQHQFDLCWQQSTPDISIRRLHL